MEFCISAKLVVANIWFDVPAENQGTCYNVGSHPMDPIGWRNHGPIDFVLVPKQWIDSITYLRADRTVSLATHHFLLEALVCVEVPRLDQARKQDRIDLSSLANPATAKYFAAWFDDEMEQTIDKVNDNVDVMHTKMVAAFHTAAERSLPRQILKNQHGHGSAPRHFTCLSFETRRGEMEFFQKKNATAR